MLKSDSMTHVVLDGRLVAWNERGAGATFRAATSTMSWWENQRVETVNEALTLMKRQTEPQRGLRNPGDRGARDLRCEAKVAALCGSRRGHSEDTVEFSPSDRRDVIRECSPDRIASLISGQQSLGEHFIGRTHADSITGSS